MGLYKREKKGSVNAAGVSPLTIAQMLGHSSTQIVGRYAQVLDQNRLDAMKKLEALRQALISTETQEHTVQATGQEITESGGRTSSGIIAAPHTSTNAANSEHILPVCSSRLLWQSPHQQQARCEGML
jgi:hypothetical protein